MSLENLTPATQRLVELASDESIPIAATTLLLEIVDRLDDADTRRADDRAANLEAARENIGNLAALLRAGSVRQG